jgi:hypothetical protein
MEKTFIDLMEKYNDNADVAYRIAKASASDATKAYLEKFIFESMMLLLFVFIIFIITRVYIRTKATGSQISLLPIYTVVNLDIYPNLEIFNQPVSKNVILLVCIFCVMYTIIYMCIKLGKE